MAGECDAACVKNIINTGLMAPIAELLAEALGTGSPLYRKARLLALATRANHQAFDEAVEHGLITLSAEPHGWDGCPQAVALITWVALCWYGSRLPNDAAELMYQWTDEAIKRTASIVAGRGAN
jgi:hypothetical protein